MYVGCGKTRDTNRWNVRQSFNASSEVFVKARFVEYTNASFTVVKTIPSSWTHLQLLGPVIRGVVGDNITVVLRNNATIPVALHMDGLLDNFNAVNGVSVVPGANFTYRWRVPSSAGPATGGDESPPSTTLWSYYSDVSHDEDIATGLIGPVIVARADAIFDDGHATSGIPNDIDREFVVMAGGIDESISHYANESHALLSDNQTASSSVKYSLNGYASLSLFFHLSPFFSPSSQKNVPCEWVGHECM